MVTCQRPNHAQQIQDEEDLLADQLVVSFPASQDVQISSEPHYVQAPNPAQQPPAAPNPAPQPPRVVYARFDANSDNGDLGQVDDDEDMDVGPGPNQFLRYNN